MSKLYKVLAADGSACHDGTGKWPLPEGEKPGAWLEIEGKIVPCRHGLHLCREQDLLNWLGPAIFEAEHEGELIVHADGTPFSKAVVRKARLLRRIEAWNERTARLFAADCAERVLPIFERVYPNDPRPRKAIEAARAYARGEIAGAARAAAEAAARDAAWDAAEAAERGAARDAAGAAAWAAAKDATVDAAGAVALDAAGAVALDAALAAVSATAGDAAWDAAWDAERKWQTARLLQYLNGES